MVGSKSFDGLISHVSDHINSIHEFMNINDNWAKKLRKNDSRKKKVIKHKFGDRKIV